MYLSQSRYNAFVKGKKAVAHSRKPDRTGRCAFASTVFFDSIFAPQHTRQKGKSMSEKLPSNYVDKIMAITIRACMGDCPVQYSPAQNGKNTNGTNKDKKQHIKKKF